MANRTVMCLLKSDMQMEGGLVDGSELCQVFCAGGMSWPRKDQERLDTVYASRDCAGGGSKTSGNRGLTPTSHAKEMICAAEFRVNKGTKFVIKR